MTLQDWFYLFGIIYFISWILFVIGMAVFAYQAYESAKKMKQETEARIEAMKSKIESIPVMKISTATTLLPVAGWIFKQVRKKMR